jgi:RNA polymerase sigma-32 factor
MWNSAWRGDGDDGALHRLVKAYSRLVISISTRFRNYGLPVGDLVQEGNFGLMQAAAQKTLFFNFRRLRARIDKELGSHLSDEGQHFVAMELKVGVDAVVLMEMRLNSADKSLNMPIADGTENTWQDFLVGSRPNPEDVVIGIRDSLSRSHWLADSVRELGLREQIIIRRRRLHEDGATLEELGRELSVSKERVRQLECCALRKLREFMREKVNATDKLLIDA